MRLRTARGPVHVWTPSTYDAATADLVIYVHGYYVGVDEAWRDHHLADQFDHSGANAMFVVCGAPSTASEPVDWESLDDLIAAIPRPPAGRVIAIAHSGGHRTIRSWVGPRLDGLVLLDAAYGPFPEVVSWLDRDRTNRLLDVSELTRPWADILHGALPDSTNADGFDGEHQSERIVHIRSQLGHMELVTGGIAIPALVRWALPQLSHAAPERPQDVEDPGPVEAVPGGQVDDRQLGLR